MTDLSLLEAAERLDLSPLEVVVRCVLRGFPCETGLLDEGLLPLLGTPRATEAPVAANEVPGNETGDETDAERRRRIVHRILERMTTMGMWWPARTEKRATARGLEGADVGLALRAVDALLDCGLMIVEQHGSHEPKVGLDGDRRPEIADIVAGKPIAVAELRDWTAQG